MSEDDVTAVMAKVIPGLLKVRLPRRQGGQGGVGRGGACYSRAKEVPAATVRSSKVTSFYVDPLLLRLYRSIIEPLITYCSICYYPALSVKNRNRLLKISHVSAKIIGLPTPMLSEIIDYAILKKARAVTTESDHPLFTFFHVLPSRRRYRCIKCKTSRYSRSFVPVAIRMLMSHIAVNRLNCSWSGYIWKFVCILL